MNAALRNLTVHIDTGRWSETVLTAVDLTVPAGAITAVLGGPGAGKSMIAAALSGRLPATAQCRGQILIGAESVPPYPGLQSQVVGYVPQEGLSAFDPHETVGAQLRALHARHHAWSIERACAAAYYPLDTQELLPHQHSGGQIQRAALAAALLPAPPILIADGPTNSLDAGTAYAVWKSLRAYADSGAAVLVVSNELRTMITGGFADQLVLLEEGRVLATGPAMELLDSNPLVQALWRAGSE
ncbi:ATP-binding cassette domain-containing protein [Nocardia sp. NPDC048505]|uniref:ATP-binding cassette domain-containing protein n=1 Tax=unclassified Nocardia TaxID=2637762 RepID=UPI0033F13474